GRDEQCRHCKGALHGPNSPPALGRPPAPPDRGLAEDDATVSKPPASDAAAAEASCRSAASGPNSAPPSGGASVAPARAESPPLCGVSGGAGACGWGGGDGSGCGRAPSTRASRAMTLRRAWWLDARSVTTAPPASAA